MSLSHTALGHHLTRALEGLASWLSALNTSQSAAWLALACGLGVAAWLLRRGQRRWRSWRVQSVEAARARRAAQAETDAIILLRQRGYTIMDSQLEHQWTVWLDGQPHEANIRADYMVARHGRRYIAEVKSGQVAPQITTAATRRQLLEYRLAYPVDGVLLVDMEAALIHEVEFELGPAASGAGAWRWLVAGAGLGAALSAVLGALARGA